MTKFTMDRLRQNLESLKIKHTLEILDNYLERAVAENLNNRPLAKLSRTVKIADASNQRKAESETFPAIPIAF